MGVINEHKTSFAGYPVEQWNGQPLRNPTTTVYRIAVDQDDETWLEKLTRFVALPNVEDVSGLIVGAWWGSTWRASTELAVEALVLHHDRLPSLKALFIGDVTYEECEISWINQSDVSPVLLAYPQLEHLGIRGAERLRFGRLQHDTLRSFVLESGGTDARIVQSIAQAYLPQLTELELWTGDSGYGGNSTIDDLRPLMTGESMPQLTQLAIRNCEYSDAVAQLLVQSPLYDRLQSLDLSLGTFGDEGAEALLRHPATKRLKWLDVSHHFCSDEMVKRLEALSEFGVSVGALPLENDWRDEDDTDRYVSVGE